MAAAKTVLTYNLDGGKVDFNIPFEYLARKFITITLIGKDRKVLVLNQDYRFTAKTQITTTRAWGPADGYTSLEVRRYTSATDRLVDFADGSILRAYDMNISQIQTLHVAEEARDLTADTIGVNNDGNLDARGRRIVNVANAVERGDAINYGQVLDMSTGAYQSYQNALQQAAASLEYSKNSLKFSQDSANSANNSANSAGAAKASENAAAASNTAAAAARDLAQKWASNPRDNPVLTGLFSAYHWALNAADSAAQALGFRDTAKTHMDAAAGSASTAKTEADRAKTEADKLANNNALAGAVDSVDVPTSTVNWKGHQNANYFGIQDSARNVMYAFRVNSDNDKSLSLDYNPASTKYVNFLGLTHQVSRLRAIGGTVAVVTGDNSREMNFGFSAVNEVTYNYSSGVQFLTLNGLGVRTNGGFSSWGNSNTDMGHQGIHMLWNESGDGKGSLVVNRGAGAGGLKMRFVNANNSVQTGGIDFDGNGVIRADSHIISGPGSTVRAGGDGGSQLAPDGNIYGSIWGGWIRDWINGNAMTDAGRGGQQFRGGAMQTAWECPAGCFLTGTNTNYSDGRQLGSYFRQLIGRKINGGQFALGDF